MRQRARVEITNDLSDGRRAPIEHEKVSKPGSGVCMAKPRLFIGSSVEGLNVAYAVQQNLMHQAETTVWDQGVFELSRTSMESLSVALTENDFAVFVFSPDDIVHMREATGATVRDNVLFEFGLFIGALGRNRVFFLLPDGSTLRLPTDLLGVIPGKYESARADGSMQAATGPACHQIRLQIGQLGVRPGRTLLDGSAESGTSSDDKKRSWIANFMDKQYEAAKLALEGQLSEQAGDDALATRAWIILCDHKQRQEDVATALIALAQDNAESSQLLSVVAALLRFEGHAGAAIEMLSLAQEQKPRDAIIARALALCHLDEENGAGAIAVLQEVGPANFPEVALDLADAYEREDRLPEAVAVVKECYIKFPSHEGLRYRYARLAQDVGEHKVALFLLNELVADNPGSVDYLGHLGNSCLALDLNDMALCAYKRAEAASGEGGAAWITANVGNLFANRGLPTEACEFLEKALKQTPRYEYAHDRLAGALKKKALEQKEYDKRCAEGRKLVRMKGVETSPEKLGATLLGLMSTSSLLDGPDS